MTAKLIYILIGSLIYFIIGFNEPWLKFITNYIGIIAGLVIFFLLVPMIFSYFLTNYLKPIQWWTPLLSTAAPLIVIGLYLFGNKMRTGKYFGDLPRLELYIYLILICSYTIGGYIRYFKFRRSA